MTNEQLKALLEGIKAGASVALEKLSATTEVPPTTNPGGGTVSPPSNGGTTNPPSSTAKEKVKQWFSSKGIQGVNVGPSIDHLLVNPEGVSILSNFFQYRLYWLQEKDVILDTSDRVVKIKNEAVAGAWNHDSMSDNTYRLLALVKAAPNGSIIRVCLESILNPTTNVWRNFPNKYIPDWNGLYELYLVTLKTSIDNVVASHAASKGITIEIEIENEPWSMSPDRLQAQYNIAKQIFTNEYPIYVGAHNTYHPTNALSYGRYEANRATPEYHIYPDFLPQVGQFSKLGGVITEFGVNHVDKTWEEVLMQLDKLDELSSQVEQQYGSPLEYLHYYQLLRPIGQDESVFNGMELLQLDFSNQIVKTELYKLLYEG